MAHFLWTRLPQRFRRTALFSVARLLAPKPAGFTDPVEGPVLVAGHLSTATGLGQSARLCLAALKELGYRAAGIDLSGGMLMQPRDVAWEVRSGSEDMEGPGTIIVHANGPEMPLALMRVGRGVTRRKKIVGYLAWELPDIPSDWQKGLQFVDEIWVTSRFVAGAVSPHTDRPVRVVGHPVQCPVLEAVERRSFRRPPGVFVVLTAFNMASSFARKNPVAAVRAFKKAFGDSPAALMLLKVGYGQSYPAGMEMLSKEVGNAPNIRIISDTLGPGQMAALIDESDVVLSLHRSEGFGLIPAEAMWLGKPVVATGWSGNVDFMTRDCSVLVDYHLVPAEDPQRTYHMPDLLWAEPKADQAAAALLRLRDDRDYYRRVADAARSAAMEFFSLGRYYRDVMSSLPVPRKTCYST